MARADKTAAVAALAQEFRSCNAAVLTEYRGLSVTQLKSLRRSLGEDTTYAVVKNTLTRIAAHDAGITTLEQLLTGPSAIAFVKGDPVEAAKGLRDFARTNPQLVIKGGYLDGKALAPEEIRRLADLESREVLLAKLAGAMQASLSQAAALFQAPLSQAARVIEALRQQRVEHGGDASASAAREPGAGEPGPSPSEAGEPGASAPAPVGDSADEPAS